MLIKESGSWEFDSVNNSLVNSFLSFFVFNKFLELPKILIISDLVCPSLPATTSVVSLSVAHGAGCVA